MQTRADSHRWSLCGPWSSCFVPTWHCQRIQVWEPIQHKLIQCMQACLMPALCIPNAPYHHSNASSGQRSVKLPCHDCPHFQTGVVGQELSHPAFAYRSNLSHTFSTVLSYQSLTCATVHINWQAAKHKQRCCKVL